MFISSVLMPLCLLVLFTRIRHIFLCCVSHIVSHAASCSNRVIFFVASRLRFVLSCMGMDSYSVTIDALYTDFGTFRHSREI